MKLKNIPYNALLIISCIALFLLIIFSFAIGRYPLEPLDVFKIILNEAFNLNYDISDNASTVLFNIRFPRIVTSLMVGMAISLAGACFQGVLQNNIASPDILGAGSGASFGAILAILIGLNNSGIMLLSFTFGLLAVGVAVFISKFTKTKRIVGIVLSGIIVGNFFTAATSFLKLSADPNNELPQITFWLMGGFSSSDLSSVQFLIIPFIIGVLPMFLLSWKMNILTLHDDEARSLGINLNLIRVLIIICATLITSASVAVCGVISWTGLIVPNVCRKIVGDDFRKLLPSTMLFGGFFMLCIDNIARTILLTELPISILTAAIGTPFFIYLITKKGG